MKPVFLLIFLLTATACIAQQVLWEYPVPRAEYVLGVSVGNDGTVYAPIVALNGGQHGLVALNPDGTRRWECVMDTRPTGHAVVGDDGTVYCATLGGKLYALNPDGTVQWIYQEESGRSGMVALGFNGAVLYQVERYSSQQQVRVVCLKGDGTKLWGFGMPNSGMKEVMAVNVDGTIYAGTGSGLWAINPDGSLYWHVPVDVNALAIDADGTVYLTANGDSIHPFVVICLNPDGTRRWAAFGGGQLVLTADGILTTYEGREFTKDGYVKWDNSPAGVSTYGQFAVSTEGYYLATQESTPQGYKLFLYALSRNGAPLWKVSQHLGYEPVLLDDGRMYLSDRQRVLALRMCCGPANTPWPMEGHDVRRTYRAGPGKPAHPALRPLRMAKGRGFQMSLIGEPGESYAVEYTENLRDWQTLQAVQGTNWPVPVTDPAGTNGANRWYRAVR